MKYIHTHIPSYQHAYTHTYMNHIRTSRNTRENNQITSSYPEGNPKP